jgi:hypothetical protein
MKKRAPGYGVGNQVRAFACLGWGAAILLIVYIAARPAEPPRLIIGEVRQDVQLDALPLTLTNTPLVLWDIANEYRTAPGWLTVSNSRIYAGLVDRTWSAPYTLPPPHRHTLNVWLGAGVGISYTRSIIRDRYTVGGMMLYSGDAAGVFAGAGYRW